MHGYETVIIVILSLLFLLWLGIAVGAMILIWRLRKIILGISLAVNAITEVGKQMTGLAKTIREAKDRGPK